MRAANRLPYSGSNCNVPLLKNGLFLPSCLLNERTPHESTLSEKLVKEWEGEDSPSLALYISMHYLLHCHVTHVTHTLLWASTSRVYCSPLPSHYQKGQKEFLLTVSWLQLQVLKLTKEKIICINEGYRFTWQQIHSAWILWNVLLTVKIIDISILGVNHNFCKSQIIILHTNFREQLIFV